MSRFAEYAPDAHGVGVEGLSITEALPEHAPLSARVEVAREGGDAAQIIPLIARELSLIQQGKRKRYTCLGRVGGAVVSYARCGYREPDPRFPGLPEGWYLIGINVLPQWRRRGIGAALTAHRLAWLSVRTDEVYYNTSPVNRASAAMHRPFGFSLVAEGVAAPGKGPYQSEQLLFRARL